jgi:hypothetical protein
MGSTVVQPFSRIAASGFRTAATTPKGKLALSRHPDPKIV